MLETDRINIVLDFTR